MGAQAQKTFQHVLRKVLQKKNTMQIKSRNINKTIWTIEDLNEFAHYATSSKKDLNNHLQKNKEKYEDEQFIICKYDSMKSLVPDSVQTIKSFILEYKLRKRWYPISLIQSLKEA